MTIYICIYIYTYDIRNNIKNPFILFEPEHINLKKNKKEQDQVSRLTTSQASLSTGRLSIQQHEQYRITNWYVSFNYLF